MASRRIGAAFDPRVLTPRATSGGLKAFFFRKSNGYIWHYSGGTLLSVCPVREMQYVELQKDQTMSLLESEDAGGYQPGGKMTSCKKTSD